MASASMSDGSTSVRGPYRSKKRIPRQQDTIVRKDKDSDDHHHEVQQGQKEAPDCNVAGNSEDEHVH